MFTISAITGCLLQLVVSCDCRSVLNLTSKLLETACHIAWLIFSCSLVLNIWLILHEKILNMGRKGVSFEWSSRLVRRMILHNQDCSIHRAKCSNIAASKINGGGGVVNDDSAVCSGMFTDLCGIDLMRRERMRTAWVLWNFPEINCIRHTSYMNSHNPREPLHSNYYQSIEL